MVPIMRTLSFQRKYPTLTIEASDEDASPGFATPPSTTVFQLSCILFVAVADPIPSSHLSSKRVFVSRGKAPAVQLVQVLSTGHERKSK